MSASWFPIATLLINLLLGGGLIAAVLTHRAAMRKIELEANKQEGESGLINFQTLLAEVKDQRNEAWRQVAAQDQRIENMELEINGLRIARDLDPFPNWIIDLQGHYIYVNREFERDFLEPAGRNYRSIIGQTHPDIWTPEFCQTLAQLDIRARERPDGRASASTTLIHPVSRLRYEVKVHKLPVRFKGVIIAYAGYLTEMTSEEEKLNDGPGSTAR